MGLLWKALLLLLDFSLSLAEVNRSEEIFRGLSTCRGFSVREMSVISTPFVESVFMSALRKYLTKLVFLCK